MTETAPPPVTTAAPVPVEPMSPASERQWSLFLHLSSFSSYLGVPFGSIVGPLVMWLIKKDQSAYVDANGKEALNFHLSMLLYLIISIPLVFVGIGLITILVIPILEIVFTIIAAVKASEGQFYRYPLAIRMID